MLKSHFCLSVCSMLMFAGISVAQRPGYIDPALNRNRLLREQTEGGVYKIIGSFKVVGSPYLFGEKHKGNMFSPEANAYNIPLSYNTYNQEVEFYSPENPDKPLIKEPGTLDSFIIQPDISLDIVHPMKFVYAPLLGIADKFYYEEVYAGKRFSLYKRYKSGLEYVSDNYIQSDLRQFELAYDFFYTDTQKKGAKKIKASAGNVIKEFKAVKDLSSYTSNDDFTANAEEALIKVFYYLND